MRRLVAAAAVLLVSTGGMFGQMGDLNAAAQKPKQYVSYAAEEQTVTAGKRGELELHFHVLEGYHVNSHSPRSVLLIPTAVRLQPAAGVKAQTAEYPRGTVFSFNFSPADKLDVYAGDFTVKLPVIATAGKHQLDGTLRYQACNNRMCFAPKNVPVNVTVSVE